MLQRMTMAVLSLTFISACANFGQTESSDEPLTLTDTAEESSPPAPFTAHTGLASYQVAGLDQKAQWLVCQRQGKPSRGTFLLMHGEGAGFEPKTICQDWEAQTFLAQGFDVLAVNRPGFGQSSGNRDFAGAQSMSAIHAGVQRAVAEGKVKTRLLGAWGYGVGATAAALASRHLKGLDYLILGGGLYDLEDTGTKSADGSLKRSLAALKEAGGDKAIEERSVAYDVTGLPRSLALYHGKLDQTVPASQAKAFSDSLEASGEYKVFLQIIEGLKHDIPHSHHRKVIEVMLTALVVSPEGGGRAAVNASRKIKISSDAPVNGRSSR